MDIFHSHNYIPAFRPTEKNEQGAWALVLLDRSLLLKRTSGYFCIPTKDELAGILPENSSMECIGSYGGHDCYCIRLQEISERSQNLELVDFKEITNHTGDPGLFILAGAANHILHWRDRNQYCGRCGHKTTDKSDERALVCSNCGNTIYPRISPATITAVFRDGQILLAHNRNFRPGLYSLIAGFVEPGETLEQCVEREIKEEVGIHVKNIRYFSSQPWSFPDSLMMAFTAEYDNGELAVDNDEILDAGWYTEDQLPEIPSTDSIAGKLIRWYLDQNTKG